MKKKLKNYLKNLSSKKEKKEEPKQNIQEAGGIFDNNFSTF